MSDKALIRDDQIVPHDSRDLVKAIARDIAKEVAHHIETMYPEAVKAASSTFLLSVRGCVYNQIMNLRADKFGQTPEEWLRRREAFRKYIKAAYKTIRRDANETL